MWTPRTRVLSAINHEEPDRIPISKPNMIKSKQPYDPRIQNFLDEYPDFDPLASAGEIAQAPGGRSELDENTFVDGYGCRFESTGEGKPYCTYSPLAGAETVADVEAFDWPDPEISGYVENSTREEAEKLYKESMYATFVQVGQLFHRYHYLRGFEQWMIDVKMYPDVHRAITDRVHHINKTLLMRLLEEIGEYTDIVCVADDLGWSKAPYMAPQDFKSLIKPYFRDLIETIKSRFPHLKVYLHSHGQIMDYVPDLIECGVDILNPIVPMDNMDPVELKENFGDALCFHGGIDIEHIVPFCSENEVRDHVKRVIDILAPGGGFWFKLQPISPIMPPENVIAAYEVAKDYGIYRT